MKKRIIVIIMAGMMLMGCGSQAAPSESSIYSTDKHYPIQGYWNGDNIKGTENGYYFLSYDLLYFWDKDKKSGSVACSNPSCSHSDESCNAYFGSYGDEYQYGFCPLDLEIYDDHFYKLGYEIGDTIDFSVYSISMDGSERKKLFYVYSVKKEGNGFTYLYDWKMLDGYYYGVLDREDDSYGLSRIGLDGSIQLVYDMSDLVSPNISCVNGTGTDVYFQTEWEGDQGDEDYHGDLVRYDTVKGQAEVVVENFLGSEYRFIDDHTIVYHDVKNNCYKMDLDTKKKELLIESVDDFYQVSTDGEAIYVSTSGSLLVYDLSGKQIDQIRNGEVEFGDSEYLFIKSPYEPDTEPPEETDSDEEPPDSMWILDKKQIGSDKKAWMKMELQ